MIILSSPSGAGKTTLVKLISESKSFFTSISHTTRIPRSNEIDGVDYYFIKEHHFQKMINEDKFLEYAKVFNNFYGTTKKSVIDYLDKGKNVIFDIDWQGTEQIKNQKLNYKLITFFILPPSKSELFKRLKNRDMKDKNIVEKRMKQFNEDIDHWDSYDFVVINDDLNKCYKEIIELIEKKTVNKDFTISKEIIKNHLKKLRN